MARHAYQNALEIPDPVASRRGRISADEEERQRRGFDIAPFYKAGSSEHRGSLVADGEPVAEFSYVRQGELLLANFGFRQGRDPRFQLCEACGAWLSSEEGADRHVTEEGRWRCPAGGTQEDLRRDVVLYTQGFHDMVFLDAPAPSDELAESFGWSLVYALSSGFQVAYSADAAELGGFLFDHPTDSSRTRVLLYETDEGGSGLLNHLTEPDAWRRVATRLLEILHVDPASGEDMPGACEKACYDCLLSFYNQYHDLLDRRQVVPFLSSLLDPQVELTGGDERWDELEEHGVGAEPRVIQRMRRLGFPVPNEQHRIVRTPAGIPITEADLFYEPNLVVWIHGVPHEKQYVRERDERLRRELKGLSATGRSKCGGTRPTRD